MEAIPVIPLATSFSAIDCEKAFSALNDIQRNYCYHFSKAAWNGAKICFFQRSYESPALLYLLLKAFDTQAKQIYEQAKDTFSEQQLFQFFMYICAFLDNCGNFKSFGDSKFVPGCSEECFKQFLATSNYWKGQPDRFVSIYNRICKQIFAHEKPFGLLNFSNKGGTTGYYSANVSESEAEKIKGVFIKKGKMSENNRLVKVAADKYLVKVASEEQKEEEVIEEVGISITIRYGEFSPFLGLVNHELRQAAKYAANETQFKMIQAYIEHFQKGDMQKHKESQRYWIQDKQPVIQTNIGFIQSYLDPLKLRAEFEGFVAVTNLEQSQLLCKLVDHAPILLKSLPWGDKFEVQCFKKPDFTSLQVLAFGSSDIPVGINIPNYDDIREQLGFKNVNLANAYGEPTMESLQYTPEAEKPLHLKYSNPALFVVVALHELLGHGSGRLYRNLPDFASPLDGTPFTTYYKENETWHSVFGEIASTYEECRADTVALYLSLFEDVQSILLPKYTVEERWQIVYVGWFDLILSGLKGLEYFDVESKKWLQAHIGASYAIFRVLEEESGVFEIHETIKDNKPYLEIHLIREALLTKGKAALGRFLQRLQVYKSTADFEKGSLFFNNYLTVSPKLLAYRDIVLANKRPRRVKVQAALQLLEGQIKYVKYPTDMFGCIDSAREHFGEDVEAIIDEWERNNQEFVY